MGEIRRFADVEEFIGAGADFVAHFIREAVKERGECSIALAGGKTPHPVFAKLAAEPHRDAVPWDKVHLFWGDERVVPPNHHHSNYAMVHDAFIERIPIPDHNVHRPPVELENPEAVALEYETIIHEFFGGGDALPVFDLITLGMGPDGHTASLFPGDEALRESERLVVAVDGAEGSPPVPRITLTLPIINNARCVLFLVGGEDKKPIIDEISNDPTGASKKYPAAMVQPHDGQLSWFVWNT